MSLDLQPIKNLLNRRVLGSGTHYADCHQDHIDCAAHALVAEVERLRRELSIERIDPEDYLGSETWGEACRGDGWVSDRPWHDLCDDPDCRCPCHRELAQAATPLHVDGPA